MINYRQFMSDEWERLLSNKKISSVFKDANPFPNIFLNTFFNESFCNSLLSEFPKFEDGDYLNEMGIRGNKSSYTNFKKLGGSYKKLDELIQSKEFLADLSSLTGIKKLEYDPEYIGGGTHENINFQSMSTHVDFNYHPITKLHRRINIIIYLNEVWNNEWGGGLTLHSNPWKPIDDYEITLTSKINNAIIFETSERSWHGFNEVMIPQDVLIKSRKSIALYFYTKERPLSETAPSHGTVYVEPPLPKNFKIKNYLGRKEVDIINQLIMRRKNYLDYLYQRDVRLTESIAASIKKLVAQSDYSKLEPLLSDFLQDQNDLMFAFYAKEKKVSLQEEAIKEILPSDKFRHELIFGPIADAPNISGLYEDNWISPEFQINNINFYSSIQEVNFSLICPYDYLQNSNILIQIGNYTNSFILSNQGENNYSLKIPESIISTNLRFVFNKHFIPDNMLNCGDTRELSALLKYIEFI